MPRARRYLLPSTGEEITSGRIKKLTDAQQVEVMRHWFEERFDPPDELPYDSSEGGYQWIWGGPYDPRSALYSQFDSVASDAALSKTNSVLNEISPYWSGKPDDSGYSDDYLSDLIATGDPYMTLIASLTEIETTAKRKRAKTDGQIIHRLLFANVITALETYLGDAFSATLFRSDHLLEKFVHNSTHFQAEMISMSQIFVRFKTIDADVRNMVKSTNWHRLKEAEKLYRQAFGIKLPKDLKTIQDGIRDRHDIVHRNGKTKEGASGVWGLAEILMLKEAVLEFATLIEDEIRKLPSPKYAPSDQPIEI